MTKTEKVYYTVFKQMQYMVDHWNNDPNTDHRQICRTFYEAVGNISTGLQSWESKKKSSKNTRDHFMIPQFIGRMVMDMSDVFLKDFSDGKFVELIEESSRTIVVTKKENRILSQQTPTIMDLGDGFTYLTCSIADKYDRANIRLWNNSVGSFEDGFPIKIMKEVLEYESRFLKK